MSASVISSTDINTISASVTAVNMFSRNISESLYTRKHLPAVDRKRLRIPKETARTIGGLTQKRGLPASLLLVYSLLSRYGIRQRLFFMPSSRRRVITAAAVAATYVIAAAVRTFLAPSSSLPTRILSSRRIFRARLLASISTGSVTR